MHHLYRKLEIGFITLIMLLTSSTLFADTESLRLFTTTSTRDSGLLAALIPEFEKKTGIYVDLNVAGTGKALRSARLGKADLLWVHAPNAEKEFINAGFATTRIQTMYNNFILLGPKNDPANVKPITSIIAALKTIAKNKSTFVSRGDDSGTNKRELSLWKKAGTEPFGRWYYETGSGMKKSILKASDINGYVIADSGTWLANKHLFNLSIILSGDPELRNTYSLLPINPEKFPKTSVANAKKFISFVTNGLGKKIIKDFKINGETLFFVEK